MRDTLVIRADGSAEVGMGHIMRALALAQAWVDSGGRAIFATATPLPSVDARLREEGIAYIDLGVKAGTTADVHATVALVKTYGECAVAFDGYQFTTEHHKAVRDAGARVVVIDDNGETGRYEADLVLNVNFHAHEGLYRNRSAHTNLLLGPRYALLRREFRLWKRPARRQVPIAERILVTLGGGDAHNVTHAVINSLQKLPFVSWEATVVVGSANPHGQVLREAAHASRCRMVVKEDVRDMTPHMEWADVAIVAGGGTCWEVAYAGLPVLLLIIAENQRQIVQSVTKAGMGCYVGEAHGFDPNMAAQTIANVCASSEIRQKMAEVGQAMVDGRGGERVVERLRS